MKRATPNDIQELVTLMAEFYSESPYVLNQRRATEAFKTLLADERLGQVWFIEADSRTVGYVVVTFCYSMEYGGTCAIVDDFYVQAAFRGRGLGKAALAEVRKYCADAGVRAIQVETGWENAVAKAVYRQTGFVETGRLHLILKLADPTHMP